jgi:hypothetical protein
MVFGWGAVSAEAFRGRVEADHCRVQAWRVGNERAETYLRLLAETQLPLALR